MANNEAKTNSYFTDIFEKIDACISSIDDAGFFNEMLAVNVGIKISQVEHIRDTLMRIYRFLAISMTIYTILRYDIKLIWITLLYFAACVIITSIGSFIVLSCVSSGRFCLRPDIRVRQQIDKKFKNYLQIPLPEMLETSIMILTVPIIEKMPLYIHVKYLGIKTTFIIDASTLLPEVYEDMLHHKFSPEKYINMFVSPIDTQNNNT